MWTGQLHVYSGKINSSHVDLHVWASGAVIVRTRLRYLLVAQAGSNVREGGSDASAFGALSRLYIHLWYCNILANQYNSRHSVPGLTKAKDVLVSTIATSESSFSQSHSGISLP